MIFDIANGYNVDSVEKKANTVFRLQDYAEMGVFENLYDYMEADPDFHREDYFENFFKTFETDGQLFYVPLSFDIDTIMALPSQVGEKMGWTLEEMIACGEKMGGKVLITELESKSVEQAVLEVCLRMGEKELTKDGAFNQALMLKILQFAHQAAVAEDVGSAPSSEGLRLWVSANNGHSGFDDAYSALYRQWKEPPTYIGYPSESGTGTLVSSPAIAAINRNCPNTEAAWELLGIILNQNWPPVKWATSIKKDAFYEEVELGEKYIIDKLSFTPEEAAGYRMKITELVEAIDTARIQTQVELIIMEEAEYYFQGIKSAEEVTDVITNRVTLYLDERK